jgi:aspartate kinase
LDKNQAKVTILGVPDKPGMAAQIFNALGDGQVNIDMIVQNVSEKGTTDITFTLSRDDLKQARRVMEPVAQKVGARGIEANEDIAKLSIVGIGMRSHSGVAATLFQALADAKVNIQMISTSEIKVSVVIDEKTGAHAVKAVHDAFKPHLLTANAKK